MYQIITRSTILLIREFGSGSSHFRHSGIGLVPQFQELAVLGRRAWAIAILTISLGQVKASKAHAGIKTQSTLVLGDRFVQPAESHVSISEAVFEPQWIGPGTPMMQRLLKIRDRLLRTILRKCDLPSEIADDSSPGSPLAANAILRFR